MPAVPAAVRKLADGIPHPVALIGCRASETSLDCCEYDLAVFSPESQSSQVLQAGGHAVELVHMPGQVKNHVTELGGMAILKDTSKFALSSAARNITPEKYKRALAAAGKKSLISSLFCQQKMGHTNHPAVAAMWLKVAAYDFVGGMLAMSGSRPMPLHELEQVRQADAGGMAEGVEVALECIGVERATRPAMLRSIRAVKELKSKDYDRDLFLSKAEYLLGRSMLADCYYYAGRMAAKNLAGRKDLFYGRYPKLVQLALDLSSDVQHLEKLQKRLFRAANGGLKG
ncbi:MAG TPA: hypothetical protein VFS46_05355 [Nitrososphaera sp.]|nr:hypothetical protein [Nitrososphaera sp.]